MNQNDLLDLFNSVRDQYIAEAVASRNTVRPSFGKKRLLLIAAIITLMALLMGSAAVYLRLQDMAIGTNTYTKTHDDQGKLLDTPVEVEQQILTFAGYSGSAGNQAAREWFSFLENYDPDHALMTNTPDLPEIPNNCEYVYGCYTQEMLDKLNAIAAQYDVKLLDE